MTLHAPNWLQNLSGGYTGAADRRILTSLLGEGVLTDADLAVTERAAGANLSVDIAAGTVVIEGTGAVDQGRYLCYSDAVTNLALSAAPPSGQSRIDLICATARDSVVVGADDDWILQVVAGTPTTGTPAVPTLPDSSVALATVLVGALVTTIIDANITGLRTLAPRGMPPFSATPSIPGTEGQIIGTPSGAMIADASGAWSSVRRPGVLSDSLVASHANFGGGTWLPWVGGEISMSAPGFACLIVATVQCYTTVNPGQVRLGISTNGGSSYSYSPSVYSSSTGALDFSPVHLTYRRTSTGTGAIKIQPQGNCPGSGGMGADGGYVTVTVTPT